MGLWHVQGLTKIKKALPPAMNHRPSVSRSAKLDCRGSGLQNPEPPKQHCKQQQSESCAATFPSLQAQAGSEPGLLFLWAELKG